MAFGGGYSAYSFSAGYGYLLPDSFLEPTGVALFSYTSVGSRSATGATFLGVLKVNTLKDEKVVDSFYFSAGAGVTISDPSTSSAQSYFTFAFEVGKRIRLSRQISYAPAVSLLKIENTDAIFGVIPLQLSLFF